jgi:hypothetical protein
MISGLYESFEFDLAVNGFDDVFDIFAVFLFLEFFGFLEDEFVEIRTRKFSCCFPGGFLGFEEGLIELVDFFGFAFGFGAGHSKCAGRARCGNWVGFRFLFGTRGFDFLRRGAEVALDFSFFFLGNFLAEDIFLFPLHFGGRTFPAAAEILVVFDLELTDVLFDLAQVFVNGAHARKMPPNLHARWMEQNRQPRGVGGDSNPLLDGAAPF